MRYELKILILTALIVLTNACTHVAAQYGISAENVKTIKKIVNVKVAIEEFTSWKPGLHSIGCRAAGPVKVPNNLSFARYIQNAIQSELEIAGLYSEAGDITLSGHLEKVNFNSNIGAGKWVFRLKTISSNEKSIVVDSRFDFSTNWSGGIACNQVAQALSPAVQQLIHDVFNHPEFAGLLSLPSK